MRILRTVSAAISFLFLNVLLVSAQADRGRGTLVVAVPVNAGLVICADKRLYNADKGTFSDDFVKLRKAGPNAVFAVTHTVGFYDRKSGSMAFDAFKLTQEFVDENPFRNEKDFWDGLKQAIRTQMFTYLSGRPYAAWPETDSANRGLLFNLLFYTINDGRPYSHTVKVFYEKKKTPVVMVMPPVTEVVAVPALAGKGRDVLNYLKRTPAVANDPTILRFDERVFSAHLTKAADAVEFARKLFLLTSNGVPQAQVSPTFDCALLDRASGYQALP